MFFEGIIMFFHEDTHINWKTLRGMDNFYQKTGNKAFLGGVGMGCACYPRVSPVVMQIKPLRGLSKACNRLYPQGSVMVSYMMPIF